MKFSQCGWKDLADVAQIEQEFFSQYEKAFDVSFLEKWYLHNPEMFYIIKSDQGKTIAFTILAPISKVLYERLCAGEIYDFFDFSPSDVMTDMESVYYYIADICISQSIKHQHIRTAMNLIGGIAGILCQYAQFVLACPITREGARMCKSIGMKQISISAFNGLEYYICRIEVTDEDRARFKKIIDKMGRSLNDR